LIVFVPKFDETETFAPAAVVLGDVGFGSFREKFEEFVVTHLVRQIRYEQRRR